MSCIGCNWFPNLWPQILRVVGMDFAKELPWEYILCSLKWVDTLKVKVVWWPWHGACCVACMPYCPRCTLRSHPLLPNLLQCHGSLHRTYKMWKKFNVSCFCYRHDSLIHVAVVPLTPLCIACICIIYTGVVTPELVNFGIESHSPHPRPWPHNSIGVSSSFDG